VSSPPCTMPPEDEARFWASKDAGATYEELDALLRELLAKNGLPYLDSSVPRPAGMFPEEERT
jgi:hypothetical protein